MRINLEKLPGYRVLQIGIICLILAISIGYKYLLLNLDAFPFNSDEAIVGLMARHIMSGERPVFFYGQAYLGSLDAILVSIVFQFIGSEIEAIRWVQIFLYTGTILTAILIAIRIFQSYWVGVIAGLLLALPTVNTVLYTTVSLGGYGEALLIGNLILLSAFWIHDGGEGRPWRYLVWGVLVGFGFWVFGLTLVYSIPSAVFLIWSRSRNSHPTTSLSYGGVALIGIVLGMLPAILWLLTNDPGVFFRELMGSAIAGVSTGSPLLIIVERTRNFLLFGITVIFGFRPPWNVELLGPELFPLALIFWVLVAWHTAREMRSGLPNLPQKWTLLGVMASVLLGFLITPFGGDPSGRYFLPLAVPLAIFASAFLVWLVNSKRWVIIAVILLVGVLAYQTWGVLESADRYPPGITTQFDQVAQVDHSYMEELIEFLQEEGELTGYTNYWVAYPLAFSSDEELIYVPQLPYHQDFRFTQRDNRYPPYNDQVFQSGRMAYITTNHPPLNRLIRNRLAELGVTWQEKQIGDYTVFYDLSQPVHPEQIGESWL